VPVGRAGADGQDQLVIVQVESVGPEAGALRGGGVAAAAVVVAGVLLASVGATTARVVEGGGAVEGECAEAGRARPQALRLRLPLPAGVPHQGPDEAAGGLGQPRHLHHLQRLQQALLLLLLRAQEGDGGPA